MKKTKQTRPSKKAKPSAASRTLPLPLGRSHHRTRPLVSFTLSLQEAHMLLAVAEDRGLSKSATVGQLIRAAHVGVKK